jgi:hypothetical protein
MFMHLNGTLDLNLLQKCYEVCMSKTVQTWKAVLSTEHV